MAESNIQPLAYPILAAVLTSDRQVKMVSLQAYVGRGQWLAEQGHCHVIIDGLDIVGIGVPDAKFAT